MPRDQRLYMTFPNDFHRHPKLQKLPVEVRWTFVEMVGEARLADNDGRFAAEDAEFMWPIGHLDALAASHPTRPLVVRERDGGDYVIRDYAEHQQTRAERERLAEVSRENGRKGGRPRKPGTNPAETQQVTTGTRPQPSGTQTKAESESESEVSTKTYKRQSGSRRARELTDSGFSSETIAVLAGQAGIDDPASLARTIRDELGLSVHWDHMAAIVNHLASKSRTPVSKAVGYAITCMRNDPEEVRKFIYDNGLAA